MVYVTELQSSFYFNWLQDFFGWINKKEIYFARSISKDADITFNTVQNAKDIAVFDSTLQEDRRGSKDYLV